MRRPNVRRPEQHPPDVQFRTCIEADRLMCCIIRSSVSQTLTLTSLFDPNPVEVLMT